MQCSLLNYTFEKVLKKTRSELQIIEIFMRGLNIYLNLESVLVEAA